jgi:hypothetical protein
MSCEDDRKDLKYFNSHLVVRLHGTDGSRWSSKSKDAKITVYNVNSTSKRDERSLRER